MVWQYAKQTILDELWWKVKLTYCNLNPGVSWKSDDVSLQQSGSKWEMLTDPQQPSPSHTQGLLPFYMSPSYHYAVVPPVHGSTGVFHNTSLYTNYWHNMLLKLALLFCIFFLHVFFAHFLQHFFVQKFTPLLVVNWNFLIILFLSCLLVHLPFAKPMPIISVRGIKRPCYLSERLVNFMRVGEIGRVLITSNLQPLVPAQISLQLLPLHLLEVIMVLRENY